MWFKQCEWREPLSFIPLHPSDQWCVLYLAVCKAAKHVCACGLVKYQAVRDPENGPDGLPVVGG